MTTHRWLANHVTSRRRAAGGRLRLDEHELRFRPHWFDRLLRAREVVIPLADVDSVDVGATDLGELRAGGLRRRLEIHRADGSVERFVVNNVDERAALVRRSVQRSQRP